MINNLRLPLPFFPTTLFDVVAIATSAGGLNALRKVLSPLPATFPAAIVIVQHLNPNARSLLPDILARYTQLTVKQAEAEEKLQPRTVYTAPPDQHLLIQPNGTLTLAQTEKVQYARPSADRLLESVAMSCGHRSIAVVLSGNGRDGAMGLERVKQMGGKTIVQDPKTAEFPGMPIAAIQTQAVDWVIPLNQIAATLVELVNGIGENAKGEQV
ncbi:chemotaxis protein CheB [filamentous cyanobacterium CCP2]|nr:chemotaxis protein CheB [filamentous cyanobacterium CCP2]